MLLRPDYHQSLSFYGFAESNETDINYNYAVVVDQIAEVQHEIDVDLATRVADRAHVLGQSLRNNQTAERLSATAGEVSASAGRLSDLIGKQRKSATVCSDAFSELLAEVANITQIERDLRKRVDDVRRGTSAARSAGSELESQLQLVRSATSQLIAEVVRMQTLN